LSTWRTRVPFVTVAVAATACALFAWGPEPEALAYEPSAPGLASLLACHLVHWTPMHFAFDAATFAIAGAISEWLSRRALVAFLVAAALLVPPVACALHPEITHYAGLSGLVIGQLALWAAVSFRVQHAAGRPAIAALCLVALALIVARQLVEQALGDAVLPTPPHKGFRSLPAAHLVSVLAGVVAGLASWPRGRCVRRGRAVGA
jgi:membrane associated rhomboid family serine protease